MLRRGKRYLDSRRRSAFIAFHWVGPGVDLGDNGRGGTHTPGGLESIREPAGKVIERFNPDLFDDPRGKRHARRSY